MLRGWRHWPFRQEFAFSCRHRNNGFNNSEASPSHNLRPAVSKKGELSAYMLTIASGGPSALNRLARAAPSLAAEA